MKEDQALMIIATLPFLLVTLPFMIVGMCASSQTSEKENEVNKDE